MDFAKVTVEIRHQSGKGPARRARSSGRLPAVLYGHKVEPLPLALDPVELHRALDKERKRNTVFTLQVKDAAKPQEPTADVTAMIRDVQIDPLSRQPVHVDFIRVSMDEEIKVTVPLEPTGTPVGVVNGGNLHLAYHALPIAAKPDAIPSKLELDVSALDIGDAIHHAGSQGIACLGRRAARREGRGDRRRGSGRGRGRRRRRRCASAGDCSGRPRRGPGRRSSCRGVGRCSQKGGEEGQVALPLFCVHVVGRGARQSWPAICRQPAQCRVHGR
jgi:large subunit ribosomal protein L25